VVTAASPQTVVRLWGERERDPARETDRREIRKRRPARGGRRDCGRQLSVLFVAGVGRGRGKMEMARRIFGCKRDLRSPEVGSAWSPVLGGCCNGWSAVGGAFGLGDFESFGAKFF
jgi:hypothetical protein